MKKKLRIISTFLLIFILAGCSDNGYIEQSNNKELEETIITIAAAASLKNCIEDKLIPMFQEKYENIKIQGTYDSSGKLQSQIKEGADVDIFISAAMKQMKALNEEGLVYEDSIVELLENKVVLITPKGKGKDISSFEDILKFDNIAIGDPTSVPAGQYAKELFENIKIWDEVSERASLGTNVTEVLNWVAESSADVGIVYSTDAISNNKVEIVLEAPEGKISKVVYPVGIVKATKNKEASQKFIEFLQSDEAIKVLESYGFSNNK